MPSSGWRLIPMEVRDAYLNMAIDEALIRLSSENRIPNTLRLYRWRPSAISVGFFQSVKEEVDLDACRDAGVDVVRRVTGGGAVYHDLNGEVTYSLIVSESEPLIPSEIQECYRVLCGALVDALDLLGLKGEFRPINDIIVNGRKISGNAQTRRMGVVLQHGTMLVDLDLKKMFGLLKVPDEKIRDKLISSAQERVTSIRRELNRTVPLEEVAGAIQKGFERSLGISFQAEDLSATELELARRLRTEKYDTMGWVLQR